MGGGRRTAKEPKHGNHHHHEECIDSEWIRIRSNVSEQAHPKKNETDPVGHLVKTHAFSRNYP